MTRCLTFHETRLLISSSSIININALDLFTQGAVLLTKPRLLSVCYIVRLALLYGVSELLMPATLTHYLCIIRTTISSNEAIRVDYDVSRPLAVRARFLPQGVPCLSQPVYLHTFASLGSRNCSVICIYCSLDIHVCLVLVSCYIQFCTLRYRIVPARLVYPSCSTPLCETQKNAGLASENLNYANVSSSNLRSLNDL